MTQTRDLIKKMADFFTGEEFYEKGEDARLELSPDDVRCMSEIIKACGNAISRQAVFDLCGTNRYDLPYNTGDRRGYDEGRIINMTKLKLLPSVTSIPSAEPKTGHWIRVDDSKLKCSECEVVHFIAQYPSAGQINFCPNCGCRMVEPQERSDDENDFEKRIVITTESMDLGYDEIMDIGYGEIPTIIEADKTGKERMNEQL